MGRPHRSYRQFDDAGRGRAPDPDRLGRHERRQARYLLASGPSRDASHPRGPDTSPAIRSGLGHLQTAASDLRSYLLSGAYQTRDDPRKRMDDEARRPDLFAQLENRHDAGAGLFKSELLACGQNPLAQSLLEWRGARRGEYRLQPALHDFNSGCTQLGYQRDADRGPDQQRGERFQLERQMRSGRAWLVDSISAHDGRPARYRDVSDLVLAVSVFDGCGAAYRHH